MNNFRLQVCEKSHMNCRAAHGWEAAGVPLPLSEKCLERLYIAGRHWLPAFRTDEQQP